MNRCFIRRLVAISLLSCASAGFILAQTPQPHPGWADHSILDPLNHELPAWLRFGGEYRVRWEGFQNGGFRAENDDLYLLHRIRLNLQIRPATWIKLFVQGQDARLWGANRIAHIAPYQDRVDLRQAYLELGGDTHPATLRAGRQEITFGEERLVGASNWANTARTFDAVRLDAHAPGARFSVFAGSVVVARDGRFDHHSQGNNLHGAFAAFDRLIPKAKLEPFAFWRIAPRVRAENGTFGKLDSKTLGLRLTGNLAERLSYVTEMVLQRGNSASDSISAWAGHWRIEQILAQRYTTKLRLEYNYASGDRDPHDGRYGTFDVLYPTPHDKYGLADQVGWKNIEHVAAIVELKPARRLTLQGKFHTWWLASATDGVYSAPGALLARDVTGRSGRHVGEEVDFQTLWAAGKQLSVGGGIGHMFCGEFLRNTTPAAGYTFPYIMLTYSF